MVQRALVDTAAHLQRVYDVDQVGAECFEQMLVQIRAVVALELVYSLLEQAEVVVDGAVGR